MMDRLLLLCTFLSSTAGSVRSAVASPLVTAGAPEGKNALNASIAGELDH